MEFLYRFTKIVVFVGILVSVSGGYPRVDNATADPLTLPASTNATTITKATTLRITTNQLTNATSTNPPTIAIPNTTTMVTVMTTENDATTLPSFVGKWNVMKNGTTCMIIQLGGTVKIVDEMNETITIDIPTTATASDSVCMDKISVFNLKAKDENVINFEMNLEFEKFDTTYKMTRLNVTVKVLVEQLLPLPPVMHVYTGDRRNDFFEAPLKTAYACETLVEELSGMTVTLTDERFQPFALTTDGKFGEVFKCGQPLPASNPNIGLIVCLSLLCLVVICGIVFFIYMMRRRRRSSAAYSEM